MSDLTSTGSPLNPPCSGEGSGKSGLSLTDAEVICSFMEPPPKLKRNGQLPAGVWHGSLKWWTHRAMTNPFLFPRPLTLNECHEVEAQLSDEQWGAYYRALVVRADQRDINGRMLASMSNRDAVHASAEEKIRALAATLRSRVLPGDETEPSTGLSGGGR